MDLCWLHSSPHPGARGLQGLPVICLGGSFWPRTSSNGTRSECEEVENAMMKTPQVALFLWEQGLSKLVPPLRPFLSQN